MSIRILLQSSIGLLAIISSLAEILEPPSIVKGPLTQLEYLADLEQATVELNCIATGAPQLEIEWRKNGQMIPSPTPSKLTIQRKGTNEAEGYYQCFVHNSHGTAMSNVTRVIKARQAVFNKMEAVKVTATVGEKFMIDCIWSDLGVPRPRLGDFSWKNSEGHLFQTSRRVQVDDNGNLHFSAVTEADFPFKHTCYIENRINVVATGGSEVTIQQSAKSPVSATVPAIMFFSNQSANSGLGYTVVRAIEKQSVSLRCFFSGSVDIRIEWKRHGYQPDPVRMSTQNYGSELLIKSVQKSDEGDFDCFGHSSTGDAHFTTKLVVYASPEFKSDVDRPHNVNVSVGDEVTFNCIPYAIPRANIVWYKNGANLTSSDSQSKKFRWNDTSLTVSKVCKVNCTGGTNDIMVIQCNASNDYGYAFSNGFINVFERTELRVRPEDVLAEFPDQVSFFTHARSDPSTPITYKWYFNGELLINDSKYNIHDDGRNLTLLKTDESDIGTYSCNASNGISYVYVEASLKSPTAIAQSNVWPLWWLPIVLLMLILFILATAMFIGCHVYRNRGEDYPVDETERKCGNDPERDLADAELQPFSRQDTVSTHSLGRSDAGSTRSLINQSADETVGTLVRRGSNDNVFGTLR